ncbi:MAG TPA: transglycosylase SLT domain-containing protein [Gemmatimonadales bacterium]|nr:transglycosylase SLT domain-containing protein [Gemmatimonadales bacterium]
MLAAVLVALGCAARLDGQRARDADRFDPTFRKYTKRFFGPAFDWRHFKAQGLAESGLDTAARSRNGAQGIMQLMPNTLAAIRSHARDLDSVIDPELNIAAGIKHDRALWVMWPQAATIEDHRCFMFASYNAGLITIQRASRVARRRHLDPTQWQNIVTVSALVYRWRQRQTLHYLRVLEGWFDQLDERGRLVRRQQ